MQYRTPNAGARARGGVCVVQHRNPEILLTRKSDRSPLRANFSSQANIATFLSWATQDFQRARAGSVSSSTKTYTRNNVNWEIQSVAVKGSLYFPGLHGDFLIVRNTELPTRARARARRGLCRPAQEQTPETMLTWKSNGSLLSVHFSSQANMATFPLWAIQNSQRGRARLARARAFARWCVVRRANWPTCDNPMLTWESNRPPLRDNF